MINDEQTHTLPTSPDGLREFAGFLGYAEVGQFEADLLHRLRAVENLYARLFEDAPTLSAGHIGGNLVFTGGDPDPDTLTTLESLGFTNPRVVDDAVRGWHHGRYRAARSARSRALLTELMPVLLQALGDTADPDASLLAFDRFLSGLPAGLQLFSMFHSNPELLRLVAEVMGSAPRLADHLTRNPQLLEAVLVADMFASQPKMDALVQELDEILSSALDLQDAMDLVRRWAGDRKFQVGIQSLRNLIDVAEAASALSDIAEVALNALYPWVERDFTAHHGRIPGCEFAILAMGKLGGREMTATSDLDLIFVYRTPEQDAESDGARPLPASQYFARLSQRFIAAVTAPTAEGILYEIDMRLRPSGKAGPIAVSFEAFDRYQRNDAWTWERMALTRGRPVCGPHALRHALKAVIHDVLTQRRDPGDLVVEVADMRARMDAERHTESIWDLKHVRGGLVDVEFLCQYLQLRHAHEYPQVLSANTEACLKGCRAAGLLDETAATAVLSALSLWQAVQHRLRVMLGESVTALGAEDAPPMLRRAVQGVDGLDFVDLVERMRRTADSSYSLFRQMVEEPAAKLRNGAVP